MRATTLAALLPAALLAGCNIGAGAGSNPATDGTLLPLALGRTWGYQITNTTGSACAPSDNVMRVEKQQTVSGKTAYVASMPCGLGVKSTFAYNGNQVLILVNNVWISYIDLPLETDHYWPTPLGKFTWDALSGNVSTPAGNFNDCYSRLEGNGASYTTFCHSVGIVDIHHDDGNGHVWDAQLASKSF